MAVFVVGNKSSCSSVPKRYRIWSTGAAAPAATDGGAGQNKMAALPLEQINKKAAAFRSSLPFVHSLARGEPADVPHLPRGVEQRQTLFPVAVSRRFAFVCRATLDANDEPVSICVFTCVVARARPCRRRRATGGTTRCRRSSTRWRPIWRATNCGAAASSASSAGGGRRRRRRRRRRGRRRWPPPPTPTTVFCSRFSPPRIRFRCRCSTPTRELPPPPHLVPYQPT